MANQDEETARAKDDEILQQQYLRALSSFEGIVLSQIDIKNKLGDRLNYSIRTGLIILSVIALSILVLLLTLSAQINRISAVVASMNDHFSNVTAEMHQISGRIETMEQYVALLEQIQTHTGTLHVEMAAIGSDMALVQQSVSGISGRLADVRRQVGDVAIAVERMNAEVSAMGMEMTRMSQPARSFNKMMPFP